MSVSIDIEKRLGDFHLRVRFDAENVVHGLLGASGCGKSMTLRCIAGIARPDRGRIVVNDRVLFDSESGVNLRPQERHVGLLFQNYALFPNMTIQQNLLSALHGQPRRQASELVREMVARLRLDGLEHRRPAQLSGGQQQRAALARILLTNPEILMLDEPLSALDSYLRWQTELELAEILDGFAGTTLLVTHSREEVRRLCETVTVLDNGEGIDQIPVQELFDHPRTLSACLLSGCKNYTRVRSDERDFVYAEDWGMKLRCTASVDNAQYAAIRAHHVQITDGPGENVAECRVLRVIEDVFSTIVMVATPGGDSAQSRLRLELDRSEWKRWNGCEKVYLYLAPERIMLLN